MNILGRVIQILELRQALDQHNPIIRITLRDEYEGLRTMGTAEQSRYLAAQIRKVAEEVRALGDDDIFELLSGEH